MGRSKTPPQLSAAFSEHSCNAKEFRTTICPNVGSRIWAVSVLLIEGKVVRRLLGWRTMVQQNLGNVQPGKMCSDTCVEESPKPMAKPFESVADLKVGYALHLDGRCYERRYIGGQLQRSRHLNGDDNVPTY
jgi:hypothetical protein